MGLIEPTPSIRDILAEHAVDESVLESSKEIMDAALQLRSTERQVETAVDDLRRTADRVQNCLDTGRPSNKNGELQAVPDINTVVARREAEMGMLKAMVKMAARQQ